MNIYEGKTVKTTVKESKLVEIANSQIRQFPGFEEGMKIYAARMEKSVLVLSGEFFFDVENEPTSKSARVLPVYDNFARELGNQYDVIGDD
jgi:hypothetical protein